MCGVLAVVGYCQETADTEAAKAAVVAHVSKLSKRQAHRGPDGDGLESIDNTIFCHERLAIVDVEAGKQPLRNIDGTIFVIANGEIYNHLELRKILERTTGAKFLTCSDCEVIVHLYAVMGPSLLCLLDGIFSFVLYDSVKKMVLAARDPFGVTTFYMGSASKKSAIGGVWFSSEMRAIIDDCDNVAQFPPAHYIYSSVADVANAAPKHYYLPPWMRSGRSLADSAIDLEHNPEEIQALRNKVPSEFKNQIVSKTVAASVADSTTFLEESNVRDQLRKLLVTAVEKRLPTEVPYCVLLSGGLDSSLVASIAARTVAAKRAVEQDAADSLPLRAYSVGMAGANSPDIRYARELAKHLGLEHHVVEFTLEEGIAAVSAVIESLETYDVTTVRASTPMYLLSHEIARNGIKVVLSGEGSDEIFGGYLYFHQAPSDDAFQDETVSLVRHLHKFDCLRANKSTMAWGIEARVPFLDIRFVDYAMSIPTKLKRCGIQADESPEIIDKNRRSQEKYILRAAFSDNAGKMELPDALLWRQKEQFSDGVGYGWITELQRHADKCVTDCDWEKRATVFPHDTPRTREAYYYRRIFESKFPIGRCKSAVENWVPKAEWGCSTDPSGRAQKAHEHAVANSE